jgi:ATP-dependent helicase IRC3
VISIACLCATTHRRSIDETTQSLEKRAEAFEAMQTDTSDTIPDPTSILYMDEDDPFIVTSDAQKSGHINAMSRFSWVRCGNEIFVIELVTKGFIRIERHGRDAHWTDDLIHLTPHVLAPENYFVAYYTPAAPNTKRALAAGHSPFRPRRQILTAETLDDAVRGCDTYINSTLFPNSSTAL